ncbi:hypothetical protein [Pontibacter anaerobius]|uniref:DUF3311 domain-containing protein n=1 Tax=Pontibacter anaerobius TaxID=2993940 RepID=A0ABT3RBC4_9BACT|nr:hypothetical protein [Pontibacter anaerobius]MCX2738741.1 hypothetical protein [Pontibacter anaerobius]
MRDQVKGRRLFFISILFLVLLNFPVLAIFNRDGVVAGVPVLYFYLMLLWLVSIAAIGLFVERKLFRKSKRSKV